MIAKKSAMMANKARVSQKEQSFGIPSKRTAKRAPQTDRAFRKRATVSPSANALLNEHRKPAACFENRPRASKTHRARHKAHKCHILNTNAMMKESRKTTVAREEGPPAESPSHTGIF
jgi:hypothetical protein